ncbi:AraC family transcriptional regulator [Roseicyclus sp. F158]|uniref:AraC family transcriptional regulator n=1 Tax=Tropicimonas omnivorans TaxID=3075590 RepID=A0ABU3DJQ7_9RHOB|nr:AraC family transcriptional regulator [Roseicyclus sp. F158]MDT0683942.1 AraC family transcriptional regulator [Roseicyclus sp. F158]
MPEGFSSRSAKTLTEAPEAVRLVPLQRLTHGGRWRSEAMRSRRETLLLWVTRGQGRITVAGTTRGYGAHNAIYIPARTMHGIEVTAPTFGSALRFGADLSSLPASPHHLRIRDAGAQGEMTSLIEALQREIDADRPERKRAIALHGSLVALWLERQIMKDHGEARDGARQKASALARAFTALVEDKLYTGQTIADYALKLGVSADELTRTCLETCGHTAEDILADRTAFEARRLLAQTALPPDHIALMLGFRSRDDFADAFRARAGIGPSEFRESSRSRPLSPDW